ncbi:tryptophan 7-halogenase [Embleya sp. AB8]|uniref:tryptophan 7-halogenase n=1 Tax=Embleya sp. AB8 TaxID=3156304 RepID=UPI003C78BFD4
MTGAGVPIVCRRYDVVVAGGGPAGASAAITLARAGRSVLLADAGSGPAAIGEALPAAAGRLLADLGIADPLPGHLACHTTLSAWGSPTLTAVSSITDPDGPGLHLDRPRFDRQLREAARTAGAEVAEHTRVGAPFRNQDGTWSVPLGHELVGATWLVDATGRRAGLATTCGNARRHTQDALVALHVTPTDHTESDASTLVESTPDGWWYTARLPGNRRLLAYFTDADSPTAHPDHFRTRLAQTNHIAERIADPSTEAPRRAAAHSAHLTPVCGTDWLAVGDAAMAVDPISSQGILTALYTGLTAGQTIHASLAGHPAAQADYQSRITTLFHAYRHNHHTTYTAEQRWAEQPFWRRRQMPTQSVHPFEGFLAEPHPATQEHPYGLGSTAAHRPG